MRRIDIFKKMESDCMTTVHTAAIAYRMHNVDVLIQSRRMKVTVFAGKGMVSYTVFSTGKLVIQSTDNIKEIEPVTEESVLEDIANGKGDAGRMLVDLLGSLFDEAETMQYKYKRERAEIRRQRLAPVIQKTEDSNNDEQE